MFKIFVLTMLLRPGLPGVLWVTLELVKGNRIYIKFNNANTVEFEKP